MIITVVDNTSSTSSTTGASQTSRETVAVAAPAAAVSKGMLHCFILLVYYSLAPVDLDAIKQKLEDILIKNQVALKRAFDLSLSNVADELVQVGIISQSVHKSPTYDNIIGSFVSGLTFIRKQSDLKEECNTFLSALSNIGGPVARAAGMLRDEWDQVMHED